MKYHHLLILIVFTSFCFTSCQSSSDVELDDQIDNKLIVKDASKLSKDKTLDIVSWNLEWFGAPQKSRHASTFEKQLKAVSEKIIELDADIYAFQELIVDQANGNNLQVLLDKLNANGNLWEGVYGEKYSFFFQSPSANYPSQRLCFVYKKNTVTKLSSESLFSDVYTGRNTYRIDDYVGNAKTFWSSGRLPFMLEVRVNIAGASIDLNLVNIHGKCCSGSSSRRRADAEYLKLQLDAKYDNNNVIVLGDYNDYIERSMDGGDSPYKSFYLNDNEKFKHVCGERIDHISISNELYDEFDSLTQNIGIFDVSISDHDPHMARFIIRN